MNLEWDASEVNRLAVDLSKAPGRIQRKAPGVFARGAFEIKASIKRAASGHDYLPDLDRHVSYTKYGPLDYEIGFDHGGQGSLAGIAVDGSPTSAPIMASPAMLARPELVEIARHLGDAGEESVLGGGKE